MSGDRLNLPRMVTQIPEMGTYYSLLGKWGAFFIAIADLVGLAVNHIIKNGFNIISKTNDIYIYANNLYILTVKRNALKMLTKINLVNQARHPSRRHKWIFQYFPQYF
ncbi:hypothetical protein IQ232_02090 [Microcystis aeruginosa LEGE 11464]|uniref:hypothetical protein n=1 Tax=Microcystis TaxID=1125 RepID=UPI00187F4514|nr:MULTISPECIES: hypothetical protein [Microcystis]MBE9088611.1 hypothetical protein [Microcystis aeruginosa LEGE 11464]MCA2660696.1 hypothetical protein [Microcystis sp. M049S2]MCZ8125423.1 hypothetical protein [Microcystis sp. LE19-114.1B]